MKTSLIRKYYQELCSHFGPQGWWPTTPEGSKTPAYHPKRSLKGRSEKEMFEIGLGAILTQNTSWDNVVKVLTGLSEKKLFSVRALSGVPRKKLEILLRSSGYFRQKALKVIHFLEALQKEAKGNCRYFLNGGLFPLREKLLSLKGVGPETEDSMLLYAAGKPIFVVDAYTRRIASRWGITHEKETYEEIQRKFMDNLPRSADLYGEYHALLVELGKRYCRKKPLCGECPLRRKCGRKF